MIYAGIDYSIQCPCICIYDSSLGKLSHENCSYFFQQGHVSNKEIERRNKLNMGNIFPSVQYKWEDDYHRYFALADWFISIMVQYGVKIVAMENYAYGGVGKLANISECTSILKYLMMLCDIKFYMFPPMYVKRIFSGKGNADKELMVGTYKNRYKVNIPKLFEKENYYDSPISDIVDSHAMIYTYFNGDDNENYNIKKEEIMNG